MTLTLIRESCSPARAIGRLAVDGIFQAFTLEPPRRAENPLIAHPAIPAGEYPITIAYSPRFQQMVPHVGSVPGRQNIEIHVGNTAVDTHGCILVGEQKTDSGILHSRDALHKLMVVLAQTLSKGGKVMLEIEDPITGELAA